jgi:hypothetical protein
MRDFLGGRQVAIGDQHVGPFLRKAQRRRAAHPAGAARDQGVFVFQSKAHR